MMYRNYNWPRSQFLSLAILVLCISLSCARPEVTEALPENDADVAPFAVLTYDSGNSSARATCGYDSCLTSLRVGMTLTSSSSCTFNMLIDWGDGSAPTRVSFKKSKKIYHTYSSYGVYRVALTTLSCNCTPSSGQSCCGSDVYDPSIQTCCEGKLNLGQGQSCCGTEAYNPSIYTCCQRTLNLGQGQSCCGTKGYSSSIYTCCDEVLNLGQGLSCCGTAGFNPASQTCCQGTLNPGQGQSCCGTAGFNPASQTCCQGSLHPGQGQSCCGSDAYNPSIQTCCEGKLYLGQGQSCCGNEAYNPSIYTCCQRTLNLGQGQSCCGSKGYSSSIYTCCDGVLNLGQGLSCCGTASYNPSIYTCCNGQLILGQGKPCTSNPTQTTTLDVDPAGVSGGSIGTNYTFTLTAKNMPANVATATFQWNFGDGSSTATGNGTAPVSSNQASTKISHVYTVNGTYSLITSVIDTASKVLAQDSEVVSIGKAPPATNVSLNACGIWQVAQSGGGAGATVNNWDISTIPVGAKLDIRYDAQSIPDKFVIQYEGVTKLDTGWRGLPSYNGNPLYPGGVVGIGQGEVDNVFAKAVTNTFQVTVYGAEPSTAWSYEMRCTA